MTNFKGRRSISVLIDHRFSYITTGGVEIRETSLPIVEIPFPMIAKGFPFAGEHCFVIIRFDQGK